MTSRKKHFLLIHDKPIPRMWPWRHSLSTELISIVCPVVPQEVMLEAGSGAVKREERGRKHISGFMKWRSAGRKPAAVLLELWAYVYFPCLSLRRGFRGKRRSGVGWGGAAGMSFRRMCAKAFIATVNIYSSGGIPWMWFSRGCCCCCLERWGIDRCRRAGDSFLGANCVTWTSITPR